MLGLIFFDRKTIIKSGTKITNVLNVNLLIGKTSLRSNVKRVTAMAFSDSNL